MAKKPTPAPAPDAPPPIDLVAERVERFDPRALKAFAQNSRDHSAEQIESLRRAFRFYGFTIPVLLQPDRETLIAGHARIEAALLEDMPEVVGIVAEGWSEEKIRSYVIWDNASAEQSTWNLPNLRLELGALAGVRGFELELTGFDLGDLKNLRLDRASGETDHSAEWVGMPAFNQEDKSSFQSVVVHFEDQAAVDRFAEQIGQQITTSTRYLWWPEIVIETYADKRYIDTRRDGAAA